MIVQYLQRFKEAFDEFTLRYADIIQQNSDLISVEPILHDHASLRTKGELLLHKKQNHLLKDWKKIEISHINFSYEDQEHQRHRMQEVGLKFRRGEKIALVGASGAGKSTLLGLLRGLYRTHGTKVKIDGKEYNDLLIVSDYSTLIPQEPEIFENTIRYNVTVGMQHTQEELKDALQIACFDSIVEELPQKLETDIREKGVNLSGGQKQRLALARGIFAAKGSSILLLDEPTSSVDSMTEAKIYHNLFAAFSDATLISSVHRLHLLNLFDHIYVLENGKIIEEGNFQKLLDAKGHLYALWQEYLRAGNKEIPQESLKDYK